MSAGFTADFFDGLTSRRREVHVAVEGGMATIRGDEVSLDVPRAQVDVKPRVGKTPIRIALPGGALLVTRDVEAVDAGLGIPPSRSLAHRLESHVGFVVLALLGVIVGAWFAYHDGIPWASRRIAEHIPASMEEELSKQALASADTILFQPSKVDPARREAVDRAFASLRAAASVPAGTRLEFRAGGFVGPNALTFPGGVIVVTDKLVEIMDDDQVAAVLAHELGHVHHRHGTRHLLNNSMHALFAMAVFGDVSAVAGTAATVPTVLVNTAYSRDFEREADSYAFELLARSGRSPLDFVAAMESLRAEIGKMGGPRMKAGYFSTHPDFGERIEAAKKAAAR